MKHWGYNNFEDNPDRYKDILKELSGDKKIIEFACGSGEVISKIKENMPEAVCIGLDIKSHPFWRESQVEMIQSDMMDFIRKPTDLANDGKYDTVIMLNSFRNWNSPDKSEFEEWLNNRAKKFITSTNLRYEKKIIGKDTHDVDMELYYLDKKL